MKSYLRTESVLNTIKAVADSDVDIIVGISNVLMCNEAEKFNSTGA